MSRPIDNATLLQLMSGPSARTAKGLLVPGNIINLYNRSQTAAIASPLGTPQNQMSVQPEDPKQPLPVFNPIAFGQSPANRLAGIAQRGPTRSTTYSSSFDFGNGEVLLPTVVNGKFLTKQEAIDRYKRTGEHLGIFDTPENADAYATALHNSQAAEANMYGPTSPLNLPKFP